MATAVRTPVSRPSSLRSQLAEARMNTDALFSSIRSAALYERPIPERHRLIFYLGHLEAFDWNLLARGAANLHGFDPKFDQLFAFGIDPVGGNLPDDERSDWPSETQVRNYNLRVRGKLDQVIDSPGALRSRADDASEEALLHVAIEHRLMHAETLAYLMHQLSYDEKIPWPAEPLGNHAEPLPMSVTIPAGTATLGMRRGGQFGWDNEFEEAKVEVDAFRADKYPVTNGKFLEFVRAGGYADPSLWREDDWKWREAAALAHPFFWRQNGSDWLWRGMFAEFPLPLSWPVYVSQAEAAAYAKWAHKQLPTEAQWHRMAYGSPSSEERDYPWGNAAPAPPFGNFDFERWDPTPVNSHPAGDSAFGVSDLVGNGWEWTNTPFAPLPGFKPFSFYPGYSANFFDNSHFVMKGGSARTAACMLRRSFRNWFQPHYPYIYTKFRCVEP
jgi:gamma-glutamyl hercynylcysteine S-oxide synthase